MSDGLTASPGPCPECGAELALDQRYCVECGRRLAPALSLPYPVAPRAAKPTRSALPMPVRLVATLALTAVGFGVVVGTAMSTVLSEPASMPPPLVAQTPREAPQEEAPPPAAPPASFPTTPPPVTPTPSFVPPVTTSPAPTGKAFEPQPQIISGTVVQVNRIAGTYAVAQASGPMTAIHAKKLPERGAKVRTPVRTLLNGTYAEEGKRQTKGRAGKATFSGTVTFRDDEPGKDFYTVSSPGASVLVRMKPDAAGVATPPPFGSAVTVSVRLESPAPPPTGTALGTGTTTTTPAPAPGGCDADGEAFSPTPKPDSSLVLTQTSVTVDQASVSDADLAGTVQAVCPGAGELVLSADGNRESGRDIVIKVPASSEVDLSKVPLGIAVLAGVELKPPASLSLHGIASDQGIKGAESQKQVQGTL